MTERDDLTAQAAAYALDALSDVERAEFERRRATDPELAAETAEFAETAAILGLAVQPEQPPASLRASVLAAVDADLVRRPPTPEPSGGRVTSIRDWMRRPVTGLVAVAAALGLIVGGTATAVTLLNRPAPVISALDEVLDAPDAEHIDTAMPDGGTVSWVWSPSLARSAVIVDDMPTLTDDETYQLWYIDDAGAMPAGLLAGGDETVLVDGRMPAGASLGITVEPAGGSSAPTSEPILVLSST
ncbi:anti-sigma factor domain-containing protein [Homoserinibacter sp. GY 40078]|uniref:anti-sigma factor n=1 Tax=Homoserinibacter sp. GY 40078 TaxID=2603275 RepID=UPI0011C70578|nr:anti-sigma factor [Homoserinibacter sp. GY 40078]TXK17189.1 anti-sigma factor [Homoserinibacter sp. GY 40078]